MPHARVEVLTWLARLRRHQALEVTPHEVGSAHFRASMDVLCRHPVWVAILSSKDSGGFAQAELQRLTQRQTDNSVYVSPSFDVVWRQVAALLNDADWV